MQPITAAPRGALTSAQVMQALERAPAVSIDYGYELLTGSYTAPTVTDLSNYLVKDTAAKVQRDNTATVQGSCTFTTEYAHNWGADRIRLYQLWYVDGLLPGNAPVRFDLGHFMVTTPEVILGQSIPQYQVTGWDTMYLLQQPVGGSYSAPAGQSFYVAIQNVLTASGVPQFSFVDPVVSTKTIQNDMVWPISSNATWVQIINEMCAACTMRPMFVDYTNILRVIPDVDPTTLPSEYTFVAGDTATGRAKDADWAAHTTIAPGNRSLARDAWNVPNHWIFVQNNLTFEPTNGSGRYEVNNVSDGPTSQTAIGRTITAPVVFLDAAGQADLASQGEQIVRKAKNIAEVVKFDTGPMPLAGHYDILTLTDPTLPASDDRRLVAQQWTLPLAGGDMSWVCNVATPGAWGSGVQAPGAGTGTSDIPTYIPNRYLHFT